MTGRKLQPTDDARSLCACCDDAPAPPALVQCLKYLILGKMLSMEDTNIFEAPEVKPYKQDPEITAMNDLMMAYQRDEIKQFEQILKQNQKKIMEVWLRLQP